jgi:hypothetical protein
VIIGIAGLAGVGKDTTADFLARNHGFVKVALADPLKRICREVFNFTDDQLWGPSEKRNAADYRYPRTVEARIFVEALLAKRKMDLTWEKAISKEFGSDAFKHFLTTRYSLQKLGTEWGRDCYPNIWVDYALRIARQLLTGSPDEVDYYNYYSAKSGLLFVGSYGRPKGVVISDVRFKNEIDAIHAVGGKVVRIVRSTSLSGAASQHRSEQEQKDIPDSVFDHILYNNSTLAALEFTVGAVLPCLKDK